MNIVGEPVINQTLFGEISKDNTLHVQFPSLRWGTPNYQPVWTLVQATQVPDAQEGDWLNIDWHVTIMCRSYTDERNKAAASKSSSDQSLYVQVHTEPIPSVTTLPGIQLPRNAGPNGSREVPYVPKGGTAWIKVTKIPVWVLIYLCPESAGVKAPQFVQIPNGNYNCTTVTLWR